MSVKETDILKQEWINSLDEAKRLIDESKDNEKAFEFLKETFVIVKNIKVNQRISKVSYNNGKIEIESV